MFFMILDLFDFIIIIDCIFLLFSIFFENLEFMLTITYNILNWLFVLYLLFSNIFFYCCNLCIWINLIWCSFNNSGSHSLYNLIINFINFGIESFCLGLRSLYKRLWGNILMWRQCLLYFIFQILWFLD